MVGEDHYPLDQLGSVVISTISFQNSDSWDINIILTCFSGKLIEIWEEVYNDVPRKICEGQPSKSLNGYGLLKFDHTPSNF